MKSSFQIGILCTVFCLGSTFFSSAVQTVNIGSTFSCTFLDSGEKGFFDSSSTHTWTSDQIDSAIRALNTWNTLINSTPGRTLNVGLTWYDGADSSTLASAYSPYYYYLSNKPQQVPPWPRPYGAMEAQGLPQAMIFTSSAIPLIWLPFIMGPPYWRSIRENMIFKAS